MSYAVLTGSITAGFFIISVHIKISNSSLIVFICTFISDTYPLFNFLMTLLYIEPYRSALLNLLKLKKFFKHSQTSTVQLIDSRVNFL